MREGVDKKEDTMATTKTIVKKEEEAVKQVTKRKYDKEDTIQCRSITPGTLLYNGSKSGIPYKWSAAGDICWVEYQDLLAALMAGSDYLLEPLFVIEDEELLKDEKWAEIRSIYEHMSDSGSVKELLELPTNKFRRAFEEAPKGLQSAVKSEIAKLIGEKTFDSIQKVKIVDEICGTDLSCLIG